MREVAPAKRKADPGDPQRRIHEAWEWRRTRKKEKKKGKREKNALKMPGIMCNAVQKTHYLRLFETSTQAFMQASKQRSKLLVGELASIG